jgi:hypothetical protein
MITTEETDKQLKNEIQKEVNNDIHIDSIFEIIYLLRMNYSNK